jgi:hypothetical protein
MLLGKGADANAESRHYGNALQAASAGYYDQTVQLLLYRGTDIEAQGGKYGSALQEALYRG